MYLGVCLRQLNTRYMNHFDAFKLSEKECRDKCDITPLCFTATWTAGQAVHDYYNCFLHQSTFKSQDFVGFIGYICKGKKKEQFLNILFLYDSKYNTYNKVYYYYC